MNAQCYKSAHEIEQPKCVSIIQASFFVFQGLSTPALSLVSMFAFIVNSGFQE